MFHNGSTSVPLTRTHPSSRIRRRERGQGRNGFLSADPVGRNVKCNGCGIIVTPNSTCWDRDEDGEEIYEDPILMSELVTRLSRGCRHHRC